eukprot:TRINITY_DN5208_c0_g1_i4.p1 TRINITY_DN5208_c0_g1~~TRINITY_DN5208_c0_g1_i4.p1  ORF type:complete len:459 (-),score=112.36 TRINITY_DN5208_c0_g1_i4:33-1409(-)
MIRQAAYRVGSLWRPTLGYSSVRTPLVLLSTPHAARMQSTATPRPLITKAPSDSYVEKYFPFSSDNALRARYTNQFGGIRFGLILEDLDLMAATVAYKHASHPEDPSERSVIQLPSVDEPLNKEESAMILSKKSDGKITDPKAAEKMAHLINSKLGPMRIVTAAVNRIELYEELRADMDLRMRGWVTFVGSTSMEVRILVDTFPKDANGNTSPTARNIFIGLFTMVARDKHDVAVKVNPLVPQTDVEKKWYALGLENKASRQQLAASSLERNPPTDAERALMHQLYLEDHAMQQQEKQNDGSDPRSGYVYMDQTQYQTTVLMHPQRRNIYHKIFGGYLMRSAFELAWNTAILYCHARPLIRAVDEITFLRPVELGSVVIYEAEVIYVHAEDPKTVQVKVEAFNVDAKTGHRTRTNEFHFTFSVDAPYLKELMPRTYEEMLKCILIIIRDITSHPRYLR